MRGVGRTGKDKEGAGRNWDGMGWNERDGGG